MNTSKEIASSTPDTIKYKDNFLKDFINTSGFNWNSTCLEVAFTNLGNNFERYIQKIGNYNTVTAINPQYTPPRTYKEKDYSKPCPEGWTETQHRTWFGTNWTSCKNLNYIGNCYFTNGFSIDTISNLLTYVGPLLSNTKLIGTCSCNTAGQTILSDNISITESTATYTNLQLLHNYYNIFAT